MLVILINKSLHTKANFFIFSLCVSDLISAFVCSPLWLYRRTWGFDRWQWGEFLCKFYWVVDYATNYVTSMHIVAFAILRFVAIKRPFFAMKISKRATLVFICVLWVISILSALPLYFLMGVDFERSSRDVGSAWPSCSIDSRDECCTNQYKIYIDILNSLMFFVPDILLIVISLMIARSLIARDRFLQRYTSSVRSNKAVLKEQVSKVSTISSSNFNIPDLITNHSAVADATSITDSDIEKADTSDTRCHQQVTDVSYSNSSRRRPVQQPENDMLMYHEIGTFVQLGLIVLCFMIGYLPQTVYLMYSTNTPKELNTYYSDYWFGVFSYLCVRLSECMNPVMYNMGSSNIRGETVKLWRKLFCCN
ncbi:5-hydroxytryptamine receptor 1B-like [Ciona intestinalis]